MSLSLSSLRLPAHPHQLEVQEFDSYDLIVDLRDADGYADDHLPGAVSVPWSSLADDQVTTVWPPALEQHLAALTPGAPVLVYCDQGGLDSALLVATLMQRGHVADALPGGWPSYRRWVTASIEVLARAMSFHWIRCAPAAGMPAVLNALEAHGQQVLPLGGILSQRIFPGISLPGDATPSQAAFETRLVDALRRQDPGRPVWVCEPMWINERVRLPVPMQDSLRRSQALRLESSMQDRVAALQSQLEAQRSGTDEPVGSLIESLQRVIPADHAVRLNSARKQAKRGHRVKALTSLLADGIDPMYQALATPSVPARETSLRLSPLSEEAAWASLSALPEPWRQALRADADQISP